MKRRFTSMLTTHWPLLLALALGLALRVALWGNLPRQGLISDEAEYLAAADWLANGRGFAWHTLYLWTRAPLYPLLLAAHIALFGRVLEPIFLTQTLLSLGHVLLTYALARQLSSNPLVSALAALLTALYLPLASYAQLLLSETLFITLLLGALLLLGAFGRDLRSRGLEPGSATPLLLRRRTWLLAGAGLLLGLATLTRGLTLAFLPLAVILLIVATRRAAQPGTHWRVLLQPALIVALTCLMTLLPWSLYATRAYGGLIVVDTTGAFNLALGARTAFDGGRSDEPTRSFVLALLLPELTLEQRRAMLDEQRGPDGIVQRSAACLYAQQDPMLLAALERAPALSQAERQRLLNAEALCLLRARPLAFVQKSLRELVDLFQINYTGAERLSDGFALGRLPAWYVLALFLLDDTLYVFSLPLALLGWFVVRRQPDSRQSLLLALVGLWLLFNITVAPLLFAINRFRIPLMPFVFMLASVALAERPALWRTLSNRTGRSGAAVAALLFVLAASPYAYLQPRAANQPATWASYLGPYPSSLANTQLALATRVGYLREQELGAALGSADLAAARAALNAPDLPAYAAAVGRPLLTALEGDPAAGLAHLANAPVRPLQGWQTALVAGELLRRLGDLPAARRELGPTLVDSANPVAWAWHWLHPPPLPDQRLELADDNDLGYIKGFYLGRYDPDLAATTRWASGEAMLRFPGAGSGMPNRLCLELSGLGWPNDLALPTVSLELDGTPLGQIPLTRALTEACLELPPRPVGTTLEVTLRSTTFVPDALDLIAQQGPQVGQLRLLAYQLAGAEVR